MQEQKKSPFKRGFWPVYRLIISHKKTKISSTMIIEGNFGFWKATSKLPKRIRKLSFKHFINLVFAQGFVTRKTANYGSVLLNIWLSNRFWFRSLKRASSFFADQLTKFDTWIMPPSLQKKSIWDKVWWPFFCQGSLLRTWKKESLSRIVLGSSFCFPWVEIFFLIFQQG